MQHQEMTEEQINRIMDYYQWLVHGDRYGLRCDLFFYLAQFATEGFPRYILFRNGYDRENPDALPITVEDNPTLLSKKPLRITDDDFKALRTWIASHQEEINQLMEGSVSLRQFLDRTSSCPSVEVDIEDALLLPMQGVTSMSRLEPDYILIMLERFTTYSKKTSGFKVDILVADQDICSFEKCPLVVLIGNGYGTTEENNWDFIAVTVAEHPTVVSATDIRIKQEDLDEVCQWISRNRGIIKQSSVNADHHAIIRSLRNRRMEKILANHGNLVAQYQMGLGFEMKHPPT